MDLKTDQQQQGSYGALLKSLSETRTELEKTSKKLAIVEGENFSLESNYTKVKDELVETRKKYNEARENYLRTCEEKLEQERQNEAFLENLKNQLMEKTSEFELLRDKSSPQDMDFIRIKLQEELEIPHRQKIQALTAEVETQRDLAAALKRELDKSRAEYQAYSDNQRREVITIRQEHESVVAALRQQLNSVQERDYIPEKDDQIRSQKVKLFELEKMLENMREALKEITINRDAVRSEIEEEKSRAEEASARLRARVVSAESEKHAAEQKLSISLLDFDKKEALLRSLKHSVEELSSELERSRKQIAILEQKLSESNANHAREILQIQSLYEADKRDFNEQLDALNSRLNEREDMLRKAQREAAEMQLRAEGIETEVRRSYQQQIQEQQKKFAALEAGVVSDKTGLQLTEMQKAKLREQLEFELEVLKGEVLPLRREKDVLHARVAELEDQVLAEQHRFAQLQRDASMNAASLQDVISSSKNKEAELDRELFQQRIKEKELAVKLQLQIEKSENDDENIRRLENSLAQRGNQVRDFERQLRDKWENALKQAQADLAKEKKRSEAYKDKAIQIHKKWKDASDALHAAASLGGEVLHRRGLYPETIVLGAGGETHHFHHPAALAPAVAQAPAPVASSPPVVAPGPGPTLKMEAQIEVWERKCQAFDLELSKAHIREEDLNNTISKLRAELGVLNDQRARLSDRVAELENGKKVMQTHVTNLEHSLRRESERASELETAKSSLRTQLTNIESAARRETERASELETVKKSLQTQLEATEANLRRESERSSDLENSKRSLMSQIANLELTVRRETERAVDLDNAKKALMSQLSTIEHTARRESDRAADLDNSKKSLHSQIASLEQTLRHENEQKSSLQMANTSTRDELDRTRLRCSELENRIQSMQQQLNSVVSESNAKKPEFEMEISRARSENIQLQRKSSEMTAEIASLRSKLAELQAVESTSDLAQARAEISVLQRRVSDLNADLSRTKLQLTESQSIRPELERDTLQLKAENANLLRRFEGQAAELTSCRTQIRDIYDYLAREGTATGLDSGGGGEWAVVSGSAGLQSSLSSLLTTLKHSLQRESDQKAQALTALTKLRDELDRVRARCVDLESQRVEYEQQREEWMRRKAVLELESSRLRNENASLQHELSEVSPELTLLRSQMEELQEAVLDDAARSMSSSSNRFSAAAAALRGKSSVLTAAVKDDYGYAKTSADFLSVNASSDYA